MEDSNKVVILKDSDPDGDHIAILAATVLKSFGVEITEVDEDGPVVKMEVEKSRHPYSKTPIRLTCKPDGFVQGKIVNSVNKMEGK